MAHRPAFLPMTLRQLKIFDTVFRHLHVTNASKELRISQPSVSKQVRSLQECFGVKLLTRFSRSGIREKVYRMAVMSRPPSYSPDPVGMKELWNGLRDWRAGGDTQSAGLPSTREKRGN